MKLRHTVAYEKSVADQLWQDYVWNGITTHPIHGTTIRFILQNSPQLQDKIQDRIETYNPKDHKASDAALEVITWFFKTHVN